MKSFREYLRESQLNEGDIPTVKQNADIFNYTRIRHIVDLSEFGGDKKAYDKFLSYLDETDKKLKEAKKLIDEAVKYYYDFKIPIILKNITVKFEKLPSKITKDMLKFDGIIIDEQNKLIFKNGPLSDARNDSSPLSKEFDKLTKKYQLTGVEDMEDTKLANGVEKRGTIFNFK